MRVTLLALASLLLLPSPASAAEQAQATFAMAAGFDDELTVVSGAMELDAPAVASGSAFLRTGEVRLGGIRQACWTAPEGVPDCVAPPVGGALHIVVPAGGSFAFRPASSARVEVDAGHALATFVDLGRAQGFDARLGVAPSVIASLVDGRVSVVPAAGQGLAGFTVLESAPEAELRDASGRLLRRVGPQDEPLRLEGALEFPPTFTAEIAVVPFGAGDRARFTPADAGDAAEGLSDGRIDRLQEVLGRVRILGPEAKRAPFEILGRAPDVLSEVLNGAFLRSRLADAPGGLSDVAYAKFDELTITGTRGGLVFDGSYTLVVGDLGPAFAGSEVSAASTPLRLWVGLLGVVALAVVLAWLALRDGPVPPPEPGAHRLVARVASAAGAVATFLLWDLRLSQVMGSSMLTTRGTGPGFGAVALVELGTLALAALLIGVPVFLAVRYGLALARQSRHGSLGVTAAVFLTLALGWLLMPALVAVLLGMVS